MKVHTTIPFLLGALLLASPVALHAEDSATVEDSTTTSVETTDSSGAQGASMEDSQNRPGILYRIKNQIDQGRPAIVKAPAGATTSRPLFEQRKEGLGEKARAEKPVLEKAGARIEQQIERLKEQLARVAKLERLSEEQKAKISAELTAQIDRLTAFKATVATETDPTVIKEQAKALAAEYRAQAVSLPRAAITAAADRMMTVVGQMEAFSVKLHARVDSASSAEASASLSAFDAKVADAKVQAQAVASIVAGLSASSTDDATMKANADALKSAKEKLDAGHADLKAARADIGALLKTLKGLGTSSDS